LLQIRSGEISITKFWNWEVWIFLQSTWIMCSVLRKI
jgi:hypothetical protein